jgi:hypothetical protein
METTKTSAVPILSKTFFALTDVLQYLFNIHTEYWHLPHLNQALQLPFSNKPAAYVANFLLMEFTVCAKGYNFHSSFISLKILKKKWFIKFQHAEFAVLN